MWVIRDRPARRGTMKHKHTLASLLAVTCTLAPFAPLAPAQERPARPGAPAARPAPPGGIALEPNQVRGDEITPAQKATVERGLAWLATRQGPDGGYAGEGGGAG